MYNFNFTDKRREILIVDDINENLQILGNILNLYGLEVCFANSGMQALQNLQYSIPDLILLDISMPEMDGYEVARHLKANPLTVDVPVIFLSALSDLENIIKGFDSGGVDYITKPFKTQELLARIRNHLELKEKKEDIKNLNEELLVLNTKLEVQKEIIEQKNRDLTDSIDYANIIQNAFLPSKEKLNTMFPDSFVFSKAKDIVSGDFYILEMVNDKVVVVVADCTGHGVPGAFISILGISIINELVMNKKITDPLIIIEKLDDYFTGMLKNAGNLEKLNDGMDIAVCTFNLSQHSLSFCGCKRPLFIIRNNELIKYSGSLYSIGRLYSDTDKVLSIHQIELQKNDSIYLFSDGYADQYSDLHKRKFTLGNFQKLLLNISKYSANEQSSILEDTINEWLGNREQVDDILVVGINYSLNFN